MTPQKTVLTGNEARDKALKGAKLLTDAVSRTAGPFGSNGLIEKGLRITNDGISIAKEMECEDEVENLGLRKAREAAAKANDQAGDGSTTTLTLTGAILDEAMKRFGNETTVGSMGTAEFIRKIHAEKKEIIEKLTAQATPITTEEELINSAIVSVEDRELGELIGRTQWDIGPNGRILAEETAATTTTMERIAGIRIDNGLGMTQAMNNFEKQSLELVDVPVIMTTNSVHDFKGLVHIAQALAERGENKLVIIARAFGEQAIRDFQANAEKGFFIAPINAPYTDQREVMKDLHAILGGRFVDAEDGGIDTIQFSDLGHATRITAHRYDAIFAGKDADERVAKRVAELEAQHKGSVSDFEKKNLEARIAQLTNGFALCKVGATSETERKRIFDKVEDAVNAVRAAYQEGTVKGAGLAFKEIAEELPTDYILRKPLMALNEAIMRYAPKDFVVEDWVRDPLKVLRIALEQACSVAGDLATVSVVVATKRPQQNCHTQ